jgi:hypothetical protein
VRGHLHDRLGGAGANAVGEDLEDVARLRRGVRGGTNLAADVVLDGAEQDAGAVDAAQKRFEQEGCCRLAVGAGDAGEGKVALGMAKDCGACEGEGAAAALDQSGGDCRVLRREQIEGLPGVGDDGSSAASR